jgi:hypothetical protein
MRWPPPWYYLTRLMGSIMLMFGLFADHTPERGTIILTGAGLLGIDKVARSEPPKG